VRRTLVNLAVAGGAFLIAVVGVELVLRIARPAVAYQYAPQRIVLNHFAGSEYLPSELRPNFHGRFRMLEFDTTVSTNSWGLRDREIDFSKPRILCLGDSFTFGFGVENGEAFCAQLEEAFGGRYDVVNAGIPGGSPDTYALWLSRWRDKLQPRLIIVSLFQNDQMDVQGHGWQPDAGSMPQRVTQPGMIVTKDGAAMRDNAVARLPPLIRSLIKESFFVAILRDRLLRDADGAPTVSAPATAPASAAAVAAVPGDSRFALALKFLREAARGTPVVVHLISSKGQLADSPMDTIVKHFAADARWPIVQEYGVFSSTDYFELDGHWLPSGHAKAARYLHAALERLGL
jgi:hypothetical protein